MDWKRSSTALKPMARAPRRAVDRLVFVDHLRAALVILVIVHHVALVYGAGAPFYYVEPPVHDPSAYIVLLVFVLANQAWFMGALFLIAGYFTPASFDRQGAGPIIRRRLIRLGVPLLVFFFVLGPLSATGYWHMPASLTGITTPLTWAAYPHLVGMGPMWFVALLLVFEVGYAAWRMLPRHRGSNTLQAFSSHAFLRVATFTIALAAITYVVRMIIPMGRTVLGFPTLSYLPQYLGFFAVGAAAFRLGWLDRLSGAAGSLGFAFALVAVVVLFPLALSGHLFSLRLNHAPAFVGNGHWQSAIYALWDSVFAVGMTLGAIALFRRVFNGHTALGRLLSRNSYAVYVLHTPLVVYIGIALAGIQAPPLLKFGLAALVAIPACFVVANLFVKLPLVRKVL